MRWVSEFISGCYCLSRSFEETFISFDELTRRALVNAAKMNDVQLDEDGIKMLLEKQNNLDW